MKFTTGDFEGRFRGEVQNGLRRIAMFSVGACREALSVVNPGTRTKYKFKKTKSGRAATHAVYGDPSRPREPPRQRTGTGKGQVAYEENDDPLMPAIRIGVPKRVLYMAMHELGINYAQAGFQQRPWLVITIEKYLDTLRQLFMSGGKK